MTTQNIYGIPEEEWTTFRDLMRDFRAGKLHASPTGTHAVRQTESPGPVVVCLMGNLDTGGTVDAVKLQYNNEVDGVDLQVLGATTGLNNTFRVNFEGQTTEPIPYLANAQEFGQILYDLIGDILIDVTIANVLESGYVPMRWRIALQPKSAEPGDTSHWNISVQSNFLVSRNHWHGTPEIVQVHSAIPVGSPTPLRAGSQAACLHFPGAGYGVIACEARRYVQMYYPGVQ